MNMSKLDISLLVILSSVFAAAAWHEYRWRKRLIILEKDIAEFKSLAIEKDVEINKLTALIPQRGKSGRYIHIN